MRPLALLLAGLFAPALLAAPVPKAMKKNNDAEKIVGIWKAVSGDTGNEDTAYLVANTAVQFTAQGDWGLGVGPAVSSGKFQLWPNGKPNSLDLITDKFTHSAIYELDGDTLKLCWGSDVKKRPSEFKADGQGGMLFVFTRAKAERRDTERDEK